ncbi:MAG: NCS2 family permease [Planctomycetaceae bacterium]|nr:NCS2 family permease [Planctomycetaceae bacterium]
MSTAPYPLFVRRDLDGFFGLFIDNLVQLLLIVFLCSEQCGMKDGSAVLLTHYILPGAAVSILIGNLFYAWQAHRLAKRENRSDVTALPYGINTPSLLVYVYFVMGPVYRKAIGDNPDDPDAAARLAWQMGLVACFGSGVIEFAGAFIAESIRRRTPRAALLSTLAGIAIGFIAMQFALMIFQKPLIAMLPLAVVLITYFSQAPFPWQLPGGMIAVATGTAIAWGLTLIGHNLDAPPEWLENSMMDPERITQSLKTVGFVLPEFVGRELWTLLQDPKQWVGHLSVIVPMGLFNLVGSLQNIESAEAGGDRYTTWTSLAANGVGTISAALFGSCFPTTIYIGHPGWKGLGARAGYSTLNGVVITALCLTGTVGVVNSLIPIEAGVAIVLWIGIIITAQAFAATPLDHAPAVAIGLFPAIAAWGLNIAQGAFIEAKGVTIQQLLDANINQQLNGYLLHGLIVIDRGYIFTCMILAAISAFLIDRKFFTAGFWSLVAAAFAVLGLTHAYQLQGNTFDFLMLAADPLPGSRVFRADTVAVGYALMSAAFFAFGFYSRAKGHLPRVAH